MRRAPGVGNGNPLQYSFLENPTDRGAWWATVRGVAKSRTQLSTHTHTHYKRRRARVHILESEPDGVRAHTNLREPGDTEKVRAKEQSKWKQQMGGRS